MATLVTPTKPLPVTSTVVEVVVEPMDGERLATLGAGGVT